MRTSFWQAPRKTTARRWIFNIHFYGGLIASRLDHWPVLQWLRTYLATYNPFDVGPARSAIEKWIFGAGSSGILPAIAGPQPNFLSLYVLLPLILIGPPTFMMGASFPSLQRTVQDNRRWLGSRVGWLQASNIFGATLGAISVGGFFLEFLGTTGTPGGLALTWGPTPRVIQAFLKVFPHVLQLSSILIGRRTAAFVALSGREP